VWDIDLTYRKKLQPSYDRLYEKRLLLKDARPLPQIALQKIKEALAVEWTYNSNNIEGNTLTLQETQLVLQEGITIKGKSLREHFEAKNHETALKHLYKLVHKDYKLNAGDILDLHAYVLRSIEEDFAGRLRNAGVRISGANFIPPNAQKVPDLLDELIQFTLDNPLKLNDIELATIFHHKFVWIHPFFDGNGRTVRLAMNLLLLKVGFTPAIILSTDRKKYYVPRYRQGSRRGPLGAGRRRRATLLRTSRAQPARYQPGGMAGAQPPAHVRRFAAQGHFRPGSDSAVRESGRYRNAGAVHLYLPIEKNCAFADYSAGRVTLRVVPTPDVHPRESVRSGQGRLTAER